MDHRLVFHAEGGEQRLDQVGKGRLADPAQAQRGQGDAQLAGRQIGVELMVDGAQDLAAPAVLAGDGLHLGGAQLDHGELGRHEEAIEQNQEEGEQDETEIGEIGIGERTRGRVHVEQGWPMIAARWPFARRFSSPALTSSPAYSRGIPTAPTPASSRNESLRWVPAAGGIAAPLTSQAQWACPALRMLIAPTRSAFSSKPHSTHRNRACVWRLSADTWPQAGHVRDVFCGGTTMRCPPAHASL